MRDVGALGAVLCLGLSGCFFGDDTVVGDDAPTPPEPALLIAVGASVTPILDMYGCSGTQDIRDFDHLCVDGSISDITNVTVDSDAFTVGLPFELDPDMVLPITAHRAGDAHIRFELLRAGSNRSETVEVLIRATDIERTELQSYCDRDRAAASDVPLGVASGVELGFEAIAMAGDRQLMTGNIELVQAEGFTLTPPRDGKRVATAPSALGSYAWQLLRGGTQTFVVYDVTALEPTLTRNGTSGSISVGRRVGDVAVCAHGRDERAVVQVTSGACRPATAQVEVVGPMPIELTEGFGFGLVADTAQTCTLTATIDSTGHAVTATFDATVPKPFTPPVGTPITATPTMIAGGTYSAGGDCGQSLTDGDCDGHLEFPPLPTDGDCYIDSDWSTQFLDGATPIDDQYVGIGLETQLRMKIVAKVLTLEFDVGPPQDLMLDYNASDLQIDRLGCSGVEEVLKITPLQSAQILGHTLSFAASNLDDTKSIRVYAKAVDSVRFGGTTGTYFYKHSTIDATPAYYSGTTQVLGISPVTVETTGTTATSNGTSIYLGEAGASVILRTAGKAHTISIVDDSAIGSIQGFASNDQADEGLRICRDLAPLVATPSNGFQELPGVTSKPRLSLSGPALTMANGIGDLFCLYGYAAGQSNVTLTWGSATQTRNMTVRPDPFGN